MTSDLAAKSCLHLLELLAEAALIQLTVVSKTLSFQL